jgi:hypothetical protein
MSIVATYASANGGALNTGLAVDISTDSATNVVLGFPTTLGCHVQLLALYSASQITNLVIASNPANVPPLPIGTDTFYANFLTGTYYLNGSSCTLADLFVANTTDSWASPQVLTIDASGAFLACDSPAVSGGSCGSGTAAVATAFTNQINSGPGDDGQLVVIIRYSLDAIPAGPQNANILGFDIPPEPTGVSMVYESNYPNPAPDSFILDVAGPFASADVPRDTSIQQVAVEYFNGEPQPVIFSASVSAQLIRRNFPQ